MRAEQHSVALQKAEGNEVKAAVDRATHQPQLSLRLSLGDGVTNSCSLLDELSRAMWTSIATATYPT